MELLEYVKRVLESVTIHTADVTRVSGTAAVDRPDRRLEWRRHSATRRSRTMAAAGYELRGVYGTEPYWPEKKLKICVTGAGGSSEVTSPSVSRRRGIAWWRAIGNGTNTWRCDRDWRA